MTNNDESKLRRKIYMIWYHIKERCYDDTHPRYKLYGGRGVILCDEWKNFDNFFLDVKQVKGYSSDGILNGNIHLDKDSIDMTNKVYCKEKCVFISKEENNKFKPNQMKSFKAISPSGEVYIAFNQSEFAREHDLRQGAISNCLFGRVKEYKGWSFNYEI